MNSAGQNNHFKKVSKQYINHDKENVETREQTNTENLHAVRATKSRYSLRSQNIPTSSRYSTGYCACKYAVKYACDSCHCNVRTTRQPLSDLNLNQRREDFKRPTPVNKKPTGTIVRRTVSLNENPSTSSRSHYPMPAINYITSTPINATEIPAKKTVEKPPDDSGFWTSFRTVDGSISGPHKKDQKFVCNTGSSRANTFSGNHSIIHDSIPSIRKKTLKKQICHHSGFLGIVNLDPNSHSVHPVILYSVELINDIIFNIIIKQEQNILKSRFLDKSSTFLDSRASVINWLIKLHQYVPSEAGVFFMSVRMFDKILTLLDISESSYQLIAMATYWIALKYIKSANYISGTKLVKLCKNAFTLNNLLEMERNILLYLHFDIIFDDPIIFVNYYIYILQLYESNNIGFCSNYLLEILTLDINCNTYALSLQAASAVYLSMKFFEIHDKIWKKVKNYFGYHDAEEMFPLHNIMIKNIILINHEDCPYKESLQKYSTEKYGKVSLKITRVLEKWYNVSDISLLIL